jgi:hypothetical protein
MTEGAMPQDPRNRDEEMTDREPDDLIGREDDEEFDEDRDDLDRRDEDDEDELDAS